MRDIAELRNEVTNAGSRPAPFAFLVRGIRRILWPFIRQYHFFLLEKLVEVEGGLRREMDAFATRQDQLILELAGLSAAHTEFRREVAVAQASFRGDMLAVGNRDARSPLFLTQTADGVFLLKSGDLISDWATKDGVWDPHLIPVIERVADARKGIAVDVGAHLGLLSARMARHFSRVVSFEPNEFNYRILVANMSLNQLFHVQCVHGALYSKAVQLSLGKQPEQEIPLPLHANGAFDGLASTNLGAYTFTEDGTGASSTDARTLDSYLLNDVAFIKIDAQGADGEILLGAQETIQRCQPVIVFEWEKHLSDHFSVPFDQVLQLFQAAGYQVDVLKETNDKQTDFIAYPRKAAIFAGLSFRASGQNVAP